MLFTFVSIPNSPLQGMTSVNTVNTDHIEIDPEWKTPLGDELSKSYMLDLRDFLKREAQTGKVIFPE